METAQCTWRTWYSPPVPDDLSYVNVSDRRHPTTSRCHSYGLSLASVPFHTPDRQHGTLCRTAFAMNQTVQSFGNILKRTFSVQHLMLVNFYSLILLSVDSVMHLCPFCNRRIINVRWWWWWEWLTAGRWGLKRTPLFDAVEQNPGFNPQP